MALDLTDKTANGNNLTNVNGTEYTSDFPFVACTEAVDLNAGSSAYLSANDSATLSVSSNFTMEGYFKFDTLPSSGNVVWIFGKWKDDTNARSYGLDLFNNSGTLQLRAGYSTDGTFQAGNFKSQNWTPSTGTWYHIAVVFTASGPKLQFFIDGTQLGSDQATTDATVFDGSQKWSIGSANVDSTPDRFIDAKITETRVWNTARTVTEINNNKALHLVGNESGLVAYWPYQSLTGATGQFLSPNSKYW